MSVTLIVLNILGGLVMLYFGAEALVRGSASLAKRLGITSLVIGLTVVAFGTSAPELGVSIKAAFSGYGDIAVGNVIGSNIFNIAVILGISSIIFPLRVKLQIIRLDIPVMIGVSLIFFIMFLDLKIGRIEASFLFAGIIIYTAVVLRIARRETALEREKDSIAKAGPERKSGTGLDIVFIAGGLVLLVAGSRFLVNGAVQLAEIYNVSKAVIGLTIVAAGTSIPELATSLVAAIRKEEDIAVGNIVGSNIFNILCIIGATGIISPFHAPGIGMTDMFFMLGTAVLLLPMMRTGFILNRWEGFLLLCIYCGYMYYIFPR